MSDKLISLIESLNKQEKIFFKKHIGINKRKGDKIYIDLFDTINESICKKTDEGKITLKDICSVTNGYSKNFSRTKLYLYEKILESLDILFTGKNQVYKYYNYATELYSKDLFEQAYILLKKIKPVVIENELSNELLLILEMEYKICEKLRIAGYETKLEAIKEEMRKTLHQIHNYSEYTYCLFVVKHWKKNYTSIPKDKKFLKEFDKIMKSEIMNSPEFALTKRALYIYHSTRMTYFYQCADYENSYISIKSQLDLITQTKMFRSNVYTYMITLRNISYIGILLKKFSDVKNFLNQFEALLSQKKNKDLPIYLYTRMRCTYYMIKTEYIFNTVDLIESIDLLKEIESWIETNKDYLSKWDYYNLLFNLSTVYFLLEKYEESLRFINKILNYFNIDNREEVFLPAKLLDLIIHYELNNTEYLNHKVKALYRILSEESFKSGFSKVILGFIRKLLNSNDRSTFIKLLEEFRYELIKESKDSMGKQLSEYFDFISWVESKIENKSLVEILQRKINIHLNS